jgi:Ala-tRNA(Pro) deacylase
MPGSAISSRSSSYPGLFFDAARLDRSLALRTEDYLRIAAPRFEAISAPAA